MNIPLHTNKVEKQPPPFSISVVLYKTPIEDVLSIINSFLALQGNNKLFLIDNSPSLSQAYNNYPNVKYIATAANLGYGAGHNIAIKKSLDEGCLYHFVVNPDIAFSPDVINEIINYMETNTDVGLLMPKILYKNGDEQYLCKLIPTPFDLFIRRFLPDSLTQKRTNKFELRASGYNKIMEVPFLSGCFMALRKEAIEKCGMFDERFFMYGEDIDLSRRIHQKFKTIFYPYVSIVHGYEAASYKNVAMLKVHLINIIRYFNKWGWWFDRDRKKVNKKILASAKKLEEFQS